MILPGPQTLTLVSVAVALLAVMTTVLSIHRARRAVAAASHKHLRDADMIDRLDERLVQHMTRLQENQTILASQIHDDIRSLQADMDWLAGERMIDEAIAMARSGVAVNDINAELGLPGDSAQVITRFRRH